jgi:hypothetical protein
MSGRCEVLLQLFTQSACVALSAGTLDSLRRRDTQ